MPNLNKVRTAASGGPGGTTVAAPSPARLRLALTLFFALDGFVFAGWVVRIPAIKAQTEASAAALGLALLGVSAGAVITMTLTGRLCERFGSCRVTVVCGVLLSLSIALPPLTHSPLALGLVLLVFGATYGAINVAMNSAAVDLVAALRRPVMPSFHAAFSLGGMVGAGLGGLVAGGLSPLVHLTALTALGLLLTAAAGPMLLRESRHLAPVRPTASAGSPPAPRSSNRTETGPPSRTGATAHGPAADAAPTGADAARRGRPRTSPATRRTVALFGVIALCTAYGEGALADWGPLHLQQDLGAHPGAAAAGYALFALAMTVGRLTGTTLLERLGQTRTLVAGGATAAVGMLLGSLAPTLWLALLGFAVTGLGLANIFPVAIVRAGELAGPSGVATASTLGYSGMLLGPPAIGFLAEWFSLPFALTTVAVLAATAAVLGLVAGRARPGPSCAH
ncbi:MFS transporter [Streptomyces candidus]|uniref:MFS family permease n=1 Tax=Streptomyces candidus TaxID=67283 RepID=A0A7X0HK69_9ACTN|nr:MFS transporter [Streptomyces candidus]MBB6437869.1 MFS family permease [Streptomyces candidus]